MDYAESGEECFREVDGGMARFVKLDRRRRLRHGFAEIGVMNAYALPDGEEPEEESMEVDEEALPPVAAVSAAMAHGQVGDGPGTTSMWSPTPGTSSMPKAARSESATREYMSLPGPPHSDHELPTLPRQDVDWDDMDEIRKHLPVTERQKTLQMQEVALFDAVTFKEYLKVHLSSLYPGQPDMCGDYPAWWTRSERHGFTVFSDILIRGMYFRNWGTFVEQWFIHQSLSGCSSGGGMP